MAPGHNCPLYKKKDVLNPKNFRPIVLRCALAKVYEILLLKRMRHVIEWGHNAPAIGTRHYETEGGQHPLISKYQIAYRPLQSALDHLAILHAQIKKAERSNTKLYVCFLDYKNSMTSAAVHTCG